MDIATLVGLVGAIITIGATIMLGGSASTFFNVPSLVIVLVGTLLVTMMKFSLGQFLSAAKVAVHAFSNKLPEPSALIEKSVELAKAARQSGILALEEAEVPDPFMKKGINLLIDGHDADVVRKMLMDDTRLTVQRHSSGQAIFKAIGDVGPAMGMIGTLIGLVQMLSAMDDPKSIGPAMAVALLTTLYGAILANVIAIPIADKLKLRSADEKLCKSMVIDALMGIQDGQNPRVIEGPSTELLTKYDPAYWRTRGRLAMSMDEPEEHDEGIPAWVMTFADLMSLLMCFFVLLLSFSEMDAQKFKQLSGSMKEAFGVQAELKADFIPKGTSVVTTEFSPGRPDPTSMDVMRQHTIDTTKSTLEFSEGEGKKEADLNEALEKLKKELSKEIEEGKLSVRREGGRIIIQIHEQGSFASGFADIKKEFIPTLDKIGILCAEMDGIVQVTGHTDDVPIASARFRSNWELSSSRAVTVAHQLLANNRLDPRRVVISGLAWTQPLVANDSVENRAQNRRVEINILQSLEEPESAPATQDTDAVSPDTPTDTESAQAPS